ncbi:MAG: glycogen debranching enzyme, partial [Spirochaetia bacterium]|nr:glycogen debranching enzyme [Spirochaetia bacterium]
MSTLPEHIELAPGNPIEPGAVIYREGVNFSVFSRHATQLFLCLYENFNDSTPRFQLALDPKKNKTGDIWHCFIPGLTEGTLYLWRADGPFKPEEGHRFN